MTALLIILSVIALVFLLLMLRCDFHIVHKNDFKATFHILFVRIPLYPKKKKRVKISDYSRRALEKKRKKAEKLQKKQKKKPTASSQKPQKKQAPTNTIAFLRHFLKMLLTKSFGYLRVRINRICVKVGSDDPAKTALLFAAVNTALIGLLETLDNFGKFGSKCRSILSVSPDYLAKETEWDIHIVLSLRVWQMLAVLFKTFLSTLKTENKA